MSQTPTVELSWYAVAVAATYGGMFLGTGLCGGLPFEILSVMSFEDELEEGQG